MSALAAITAALAELGMEVRTGTWTDHPGAEHIILQPLFSNIFEADNRPYRVTQLVDIHLFAAGDYDRKAKQVIGAVAGHGLAPDDYRYVEYNQQTRLHHAVVTVSAVENWEEEE